MTTKQQEREALEKIKGIVEELGENSYIGKAFEGCFEMARENIEDDFFDSWKERAERANREADMWRSKANELSARVASMHASIMKLEFSALDHDDLMECIDMVRERLDRCEAEIRAEAEAIIENAENPESDAFKDAVRRHKIAKDAKAHYEAMLERLDGVKH